MDERLYNWAKRFTTGCLRKRPYKSEQQAKEKANQILKKAGKVMHCYICPYCGYYHLTKRDPANWARKIF